MRLRQAHALFTTANALEAAGIGIEMHPFDVDEYTSRHVTSDHMTGFAEYTDPDNPTRNARIYNIDIYPGPTDDEIAVYVTFGLGPDGEPLLSEAFPALARSEYSDVYEDRSAAVVEVVTAAINEHEKPYVAAYQQRAGEDTAVSIDDDFQAHLNQLDNTLGPLADTAARTRRIKQNRAALHADLATIRETLAYARTQHTAMSQHLNDATTSLARARQTLNRIEQRFAEEDDQ